MAKAMRLHFGYQDSAQPLAQHGYAAEGFGIGMALSIRPKNGCAIRQAVQAESLMLA
jgi:hypothetical protein